MPDASRPDRTYVSGSATPKGRVVKKYRATSQGMAARGQLKVTPEGYATDMGPITKGGMAFKAVEKSERMRKIKRIGKRLAAEAVKATSAPFKMIEKISEGTKAKPSRTVRRKKP